MPPDLVYDSDFERVERLPDGGRIKIRLIRPEDKANLAAGLSELSPRSRYMRFFSLKSQLSPDELRQLTELDTENHLALVALYLDEDDGERGAAVARFVRHAEDPKVAEPAIVVVDALQGRGIGTALLAHLYRAAAERGIDWFEYEFLTENQVLRQLVEGLSPDAQLEALDDGTVRARVPVRDPDEARPVLAAVVMAHAALGRLTLKWKGQEDGHDV